MRGFFRSPLHRKKFKENVTLLAMIIGLMALIWIVSMVKISGAS